MSLLPSRGPETSTAQEGELSVVGVDEDVESLFDALGSETAREVLNAVYAEPGTPSEIADRLDMSIQKVSYHVDKLAEEDLIAVAGTRYSEKGQEMTVYEPPDEPIALFVGTRERKQSLKTLLGRLLPGIGVLGLASLAVQRVLGRNGGLLPTFGGASADGGEPAPVSSQSGGQTANDSADVGLQVAATETPQPTADGAEPTVTVAEAAGQTLPPGLLFFLGGLLVLALVVAWWRYRVYDQNQI